MLLGSCLIQCDVRPGNKRLSSLPLLKSGAATVLNWCSDQRGIWAEGPAAPSNTTILGTPGCCSCLSWLTTSPFDPSHEPWRAPRCSRRKHKYKKCMRSQKHRGYTHKHRMLVRGRTHTYSHTAGFNEWFSEAQHMHLNQKGKGDFIGHRWRRQRKHMRTLVSIHHPGDGHSN